MTDTIVITGASGTIGQSVVPAFERAGWRTVATSRRDADGIRGIDLVANADGFKRLLAETRPDAVVHLAAVGVHGDRSFWADLVAGNVLATAVVLDAARGAGVSRVVHVTTDLASEVGDAYGLTKRMAEELVEHASARESLGVVNLRLPVVFGPPGASSAFVQQAVRAAGEGRPLDLRTPERVRGFLHIDDAADAIVHAVEGPLAAITTVRASPAVECTLAEFVDALAALAAGTPTRLPAPDRHATDLPGWEPRRTLADGLQRQLTSPCHPRGSKREGSS